MLILPQLRLLSYSKNLVLDHSIPHIKKYQKYLTDRACVCCRLYVIARASGCVGRVVECIGLENRRASNSSESSNLSRTSINYFTLKTDTTTGSICDIIGLQMRLRQAGFVFVNLIGTRMFVNLIGLRICDLIGLQIRLRQAGYVYGAM